MEQAFFSMSPPSGGGQQQQQTAITSQHGIELNWFAMFLIPIPVWIFFGNLTVLVVIAENASLRRTWSNKIIFSLALTDMTISVFVMPFSAIGQLCNGYWPFGFAVCTLHVISDVYFCSSSIMHLLLIAVNRYAAIGWPISYRRVNMAVGLQAILLSGVWCLPMIIIAPLVIHIFYDSETIYKEGHCDIFYNTFILYGSISLFYFPLLIMIAVDIRSFFLLRSKSRTSGRLKSIVIHVGIEQIANNAGTLVVMDNHARKNSVLGHLERLRNRLLTKNGRDNRPPFATNMRNKTSNDNCCDLVNKSRECSPNHQGSYEMRRNNSSQDAAEISNGSSKNSSPGRNSPTKDNPEESHVTLHKFRKSVSTLSVIATPVKNFFRKQRAETALLTVFIVFVICWMPFFTTNVLQTVIPAIKEAGALFMAFVWLGYCSSGLNPIIYPVFNSEYRKCFMKTFGTAHSPLNRQSTSSITRNREVPTSTAPEKNNNGDTQCEQESTSPQATSLTSGAEMHLKTETLPTPQSGIVINNSCIQEQENEDASAVPQIPANERLAVLIAENDKRLSLIDDDEDTIVISV